MKQSITSAFELYLSRADLRPNSVRLKKKALEMFVRWFGDLSVEAVTPAIAEDYKAMLAGDGRSRQAANVYLANFRPFWRRLRDHGRIDVDPFAHVSMYKVDRHPPKAFEAIDLERMAGHFDLLWRVRFCLGLLGCRRGEMLNVIVREFHLESHDSHIEIQSKARTDKTWRWGVKTYDVRYVGLPEVMTIGDKSIFLHSDIVRLMEALPADQPYLCLEPRYYQRMIKRHREDRLTDQDYNDPAINFNRLFRSKQKLAGILDTKRYHELRAGYVTAIAARHGIKAAADAAGIKSLQTAARYDRKTVMAIVSESNDLMQTAYKSI